MKKLQFMIIAMAVCTTIHGQQINQSNNHYRSYDVLEKKQVTVKGFDMNGSENRPLTHLILKYLPHFISFRGVFQRFACQFVRNFVYLPAKERIKDGRIWN